MGAYSMGLPFSKWDVILIWRADLQPTPKDKFCICLCPERFWFYYINTKPPKARKSKKCSIRLDSSEVYGLTHASYIDITSIVCIPESDICDALADEKRRKGSLIPEIRERILSAVQNNGVLTPAQRAVVLEG
jgi:hypothetical protein